MDRPALAKAFDEWMRRYKADPSKFLPLDGVDQTYGEACADYLLTLLDEQKAPQPQS